MKRDPGPTEVVLATLPINLVERARALFDLAVVALQETGLDEVDAAGVIAGWSEGLCDTADNEEDEDEAR